MINLPPKPTPSISTGPEQLSAGYAELQGVDQALREAEQSLKAAHRDFANRQGPRPDSVYQEVVRLRGQSRLLLNQLAALLLRDESRPPQCLTGTPSRR